MKRNKLSWLLTVALAATACNQSDFGEPNTDPDQDGDAGDDDDGPGDGARDPDADVSCESNDECSMGEVCHESVCQMARCKDGPYLSDLPMPKGMKFYIDRELVVTDSMPSEGSYFVDGYMPEVGSVEYPGSWNMGDTQLADVAGGDFLGKNPELFAVARKGDSRITVGGGEEDEIELDVAFAPRAIAAGDVDGDLKDELIALGQFGNVAICQVDEASCSTFIIQNGNGEDVTIGDIDGDGFGEVAFLLSQGDTRLIYVWAADSEQTGHEDFQTPLEGSQMRIDAGDLDGDGTDELLAIADDGLISSAMLYLYSAADGQVSLLSSQEIDDSSRDLSLADVDMDDTDELLILREQRVVGLYRPDEQGSMALEFTHELQVSADPDRIAATDFDGDSPRTRLVSDEPELLPGPIVPTMVLHFPPFDAEHSNGEPWAMVGRDEAVSEETADTVLVTSHIDLGVSQSLFGIFSGGMGTKIYNEVSKSHGEGVRKSVGTRVLAAPDRDTLGYSYGLVSLTCECFHLYRYEFSDPMGRLGDGGDGEEFVLLMPVGGTTTLWSSHRYNAMAEAVGNLPTVEIPYEVGNLESYPRGPQRANGDPIAKEDFVFEDVPSFLVSDVGKVGWWLSVEEFMSNETAIRSKLDIYGELGLGPLKFGAGLGAGWAQSHYVRISDIALFGGNVPPVPDDPATPEDEYLENAYSFTPYVYREHYKDADGDDASYYVMSYAVAQD